MYLEGDSEAQAALRRLKERAKATGADLFELILSGSVAEWEAFIISSFQAGCSADITEGTAQHQVGVMGTLHDMCSRQQHESYCCWQPPSSALSCWWPGQLARPGDVTVVYYISKNMCFQDTTVQGTTSSCGSVAGVSES